MYKDVAVMCTRVYVHYNFFLSHIISIIVLETLNWEFRMGFPWELLYTDSREPVELLLKFETCETGMENECQQVNMGKINILVSRSISSRLSCLLWVQNNCSGIKAHHLSPVPEFMHLMPGQCKGDK